MLILAKVFVAWLMKVSLLSTRKPRSFKYEKTQILIDLQTKSRRVHFVRQDHDESFRPVYLNFVELTPLDKPNDAERTLFDIQFHG